MQTFGEEYTIFGDDYSYMGEPIDEDILDNIQSTLPKNISFYNDAYSAYTILAFQKQIEMARITKKIALNKKYDLHDKYELITPELIIRLQPHIKIHDLRNEILNYESDDDSVTDFDTVSRIIS